MHSTVLQALVLKHFNFMALTIRSDKMSVKSRKITFIYTAQEFFHIHLLVTVETQLKAFKY